MAKKKLQKVSKKEPRKKKPAKRVLKTSKKYVKKPPSPKKSKKVSKEEYYELERTEAESGAKNRAGKKRVPPARKLARKTKPTQKRATRNTRKVSATKPGKQKSPSRRTPEKPVKLAPLLDNRLTKTAKKAPPQSRKIAQMPTRAKKDRESTIVPLNPKNGKEVRKPLTGQDVIYGIKDAKGKITKIESRFFQAYSKADQSGLQKIIDRTGKKGFVVYEQLTNRKYKDPKTGIIYQAEKITYGKSNTNQRPILYADGKRVRELDLGFRQRTKREMVDDLLLRVIKPDGKFVRDIRLEGDTIKDTVKNLAVKLTMAQVKKAELEGLYFEIVLHVRGEEPIVVYGRTETYANITTDIARSIRFTLANRGLRFTSLLNLQELASDAEDSGDDEMAHKILTVGRDRTPIEALNPIFPENEFGHDTGSRAGSGRVSMDIKISGIG